VALDFIESLTRTIRSPFDRLKYLISERGKVISVVGRRLSPRPNAAREKQRMKRYAAELIGTFVLVFGGCGAAVLAGSHIGFEGVAFAFGFSLLVMA
jgi:hypothetical protein